MKILNKSEYNFSFKKTGKEYNLYINKDKKTIGSLFFSRKNIETTMFEIGYKNFSLEDSEQKKEIYDKIERLFKDYKKTIKIDHFHILEEFRNKGIGKKLFEEGLRYIEHSLNINFVFLEVLPLENNKVNGNVLIEMYSKFGFEKLSDNNYKYLMFKDENFIKLKLEKKVNIKNDFINNNVEIEELLNIKDLEMLDDYDNNEDILSNFC